jgi:ATP-dependent exoDNAse (exonuclease V) alpha subunit
LSGSDSERIKELKRKAESAPLHGLFPSDPDVHVRFAIEHLFERLSVVRGSQVLSEALIHAKAAILDPGALKRAFLSCEGLIFRESQITTTEHLDREKELVAWIDAKPKGVALPVLKEECALSFHQKRAINGLLCSSEQFNALSGKAGTGKSRSISWLIRQNLLYGYQVFALAPSTKSRDVLECGTRMTLQKFLESPQTIASVRPLDLVVLDEAGFASVQQVHGLLAHARNRNFRVLLCGDRHQHVSVQAGDSFRIILARTKIQREWLDRIVRQDPGALDGRYLRACKFFSRGQATEGFATLDRAGAIRVAKGEDRLREMAELIVSEEEAGRSVIAVQPSHRENDLLNEAVRSLLKTKGLLSQERTILAHRSLNWTLAQKAEISRIAPGMILELTHGKDKGRAWTVISVNSDRCQARSGTEQRTFFSSNAPMFEVCARRELKVAVGDSLMIACGMHTFRGEIANGARLKVAGWSEGGDPIAEDGTEIRTRNLVHAYSSTSHKCQGDSCDHVVLGIDRKSVTWVDRKLAYVGTTRGRFKITLFCESKADLLGIEKRSGDRKSALELVAKNKRLRKPMVLRQACYRDW